MRWFVVGAGSIGQRHLRNLAWRGERDLVAVRRKDEALAGELREVRVVTDLAAARGSGDAIAIICTPTASHVEDALEAVRAGCHVLVEKPLAHRLDRLGELRDAARSAGKQLGVAHCFRFHPLLQLVQRALAGGRIGAALGGMVWCGQHLADWRPARDYRDTYSAKSELGGGVLLDLVHELDYIDWLVGPVEKVSAEARNTGVLGIDAEDVADVSLSARGGAVIACHLDYLARPALRGGRIIGERGTIAWDLLAGTGTVTDGRSTEPLAVPLDWQLDDMYRAELSAFANSVADRGRYPVDIETGARAVRIALAARESAAHGKRIAL
jgi:predicted dehydrogenase